MLRFLIPFILLLLLEVYTFFALKTLTKSKFVLVAYWVVFVIVIAIVYYQFNIVQSQSRFSLNTGYAIALLLTYFVPKAIVFIFLFGEDIFRFFATLANYFSLDLSVKEAIPSRRKFVSQIALSIAAIPFAGFLYGVFKGKYDFRVITQQIEFDDLPNEFDGYRITQISDIHSGSFDNIEKIEYAINLINEQQSNAILFTGDIVNARAEEMYPYVDVFSKLRAKDGKFSVLGNHDYGYYAYDSVEDFNENHKKIEAVHKSIGFDLLQNENRTIVRGEAKLNILGVENWGASRHFPKRGSLEKVTRNLPDDAFNVLMSHDPSHFDYKEKEFNNQRDRFNLDMIKDETNIINFNKKIQLTLAGHTHGMQFGIEIPFLNFKWSPVKYRYPKWAGLYQEAGKYLYVNRGFGFLAFPGRVGIWPEITVLELKKRVKRS
ncbi:metallophosphoesterase [Aurantibacter sp.]|uniref:metallophosphoesterase n=1 Tax=Aurantibacter sp. TaxID=2807103 RepID=UPI0035C87013